MVNEETNTGRDASPARPSVRSIGPKDLKDALTSGFADFGAMPTHLVFLGLIYPMIMLVSARLYAGYEVLPLVFPLLAGYTLIGPLVAVGMYELSRRRELGLDISRMHAFDIFRSRSIGAIGKLGLLLMAIYVLWLGAAYSIWVRNMGSAMPESISGFIGDIFTTDAGWTLIIVGSGAGCVFAGVVFSLSVVSFPLLLDQRVSVMTAIQTSVDSVKKNPVTMTMWGFIVAAFLLIGSLPAFLGLAVAMPVLGHATWHLYRKVVVR